MDSVYVGGRAEELYPGTESQPISRVVLLDTNGDILAEVGDDTGGTITATNPDATSAMASYILSKVRGYTYYPYEGKNALIDPAAELGDGITIGGLYSVLAERDTEYGPACASNVKAPTEDELDDEYPYVSPFERQMKRQWQNTRSLISRTNEEILLMVENAESGVASLSTQVNSITAQVSSYDSQLSQTVRIAPDGVTITNASGQTLLIDGSNINVDTLTISASNITGKIGADKLEEDYATATELQVTKSGLTTKINSVSGNVSMLEQTVNGLQTQVTNANGDISSLQQTATSLQSAIATANGNISSLQQTANSLTSSIAAANGNISTLQQTIDGLTVTTSSGTTVIAGNKVETGTVIAGNLLGNSIYLYNSAGYMGGSITVQGASSYMGRKLVIDSGAVELSASYGDIYLGTSMACIQLYGNAGNAIALTGWTYPTSSSYWCGAPRYPWGDMYCVNELTVTSDREKKRDISYGLEKYRAFFDRLKPCSFRFIENSHDRIHLGMISQDVEEAMEACGIDSMDFAGFIKSPKKDDDGNEIPGEYTYALRYGEFISLLIDQVQKLKSRVSALEGGNV